jgi:hypothetical protein
MKRGSLMLRKFCPLIIVVGIATGVHPVLYAWAWLLWVMPAIHRMDRERFDHAGHR